MRIRNRWFDLFSFCVAVLMSANTYFTISGYLRKEETDIGATIFFTVFYFCFAVLYFTISLQIGSLQKRIRERKRKRRNGNICEK